MSAFCRGENEGIKADLLFCSFSSTVVPVWLLVQHRTVDRLLGVFLCLSSFWKPPGPSKVWEEGKLCCTCSAFPSESLFSSINQNVVGYTNLKPWLLVGWKVWKNYSNPGIWLQLLPALQFTSSSSICIKNSWLESETFSAFSAERHVLVHSGGEWYKGRRIGVVTFISVCLWWTPFLVLRAGSPLRHHLNMPMGAVHSD